MINLIKAASQTNICPEPDSNDGIPERLLKLASESFRGIEKRIIEGHLKPHGVMEVSREFLVDDLRQLKGNALIGVETANDIWCPALLPGSDGIRTNPIGNYACEDAEDSSFPFRLYRNPPWQDLSLLLRFEDIVLEGNPEVAFAIASFKRELGEEKTGVHPPP